MTDNGYQYAAGDVFPRAGLEVEQERIDQLLGDKNALKQSVIVSIERKAEENPVLVEEANDPVIVSNVPVDKKPRTGGRKRTR